MDACSPKTDQEYHKQILGIWSGEESLNFFMDNGDLYYTQNDGAAIHGAWWIKEGKLYESVLGPLHPFRIDMKNSFLSMRVNQAQMALNKILPVGTQTVDKILCIEKEYLKLESEEDGGVYYRYREHRQKQGIQSLVS